MSRIITKYWEMSLSTFLTFNIFGGYWLLFLLPMPNLPETTVIEEQDDYFVYLDGNLLHEDLLAPEIEEVNGKDVENDNKNMDNTQLDTTTEEEDSNAQSVEPEPTNPVLKTKVKPKPKASDRKETKRKKRHTRKGNAKNGKKKIATSTERPQRTRGKKRGRCTPDVDGIEKVRGGKYKIKKQVVKKYAKIRGANRLASVKWEKNKRGKNVGVKIRRVRCKSPLRLLGIRRGDVIVAINGKKIKDYPSALVAFYKLKHGKKLRVLIKRKNKKVRLQYRLIG